MTALATSVSPFISHISTAPVEVFLHSRSLQPSPLKSATNSTVQAGSVRSVADALTAVPFISHARVAPAVLRQMRSVLSSPSRSPVAVTVHVGSVDIVAVDAAESPFINQSDVWPFAALRHARSALALLSKSNPTDAGCASGA